MKPKKSKCRRGGPGSDPGATRGHHFGPLGALEREQRAPEAARTAVLEGVSGCQPSGCPLILVPESEHHLHLIKCSFNVNHSMFSVECQLGLAQLCIPLLVWLPCASRWCLSIWSTNLFSFYFFLPPAPAFFFSLPSGILQFCVCACVWICLVDSLINVYLGSCLQPPFACLACALTSQATRLLIPSLSFFFFLSTLVIFSAVSGSALFSKLETPGSAPC